MRIDLAGLFDFGGHVPVLDEAGLTRGTLTTRGGLVIPGAGYCFITPVRFCLGALAGVRIVEGESSGLYVFKQTLSRVAPFVFGPNAQLALTPGPFRLALDASLLVTPVAPTFSVEGLDARLSLPTVQALFRLSIGFGVSR